MFNFINLKHKLFILERLLWQVGIELSSKGVTVKKWKREGRDYWSEKQTYSGLAKAKRMAENVVVSNEEERIKLKLLIDLSTKIHFQLRSNRLSFYQHIEEFCNELFELGVALKLVRVEEKKQARNRFLNVAYSKGKDKLLRINPGATAATLIAAIFNLSDKRMKTLGRVDAIYSIRQNLLVQILKLYFDTFEEYHKLVREQVEKISEVSIEILAESLNKLLLLKTPPYKTISITLCKNLSEAIRLLKDKQLDVSNLLNSNLALLDELDTKCKTLRRTISTLKNHPSKLASYEAFRLCEKYADSLLAPVFAEVKEAVAEAIKAFLAGEEKNMTERLDKALERVDW